MSMREAQSFENMGDLRKYIQEKLSRVCTFMGSEDPFRDDEIVIGEVFSKNDIVSGWKNVREVGVMRIGKVPLDCPLCIGYCGEE